MIAWKILREYLPPYPVYFSSTGIELLLYWKTTIPDWSMIWGNWPYTLIAWLHWPSHVITSRHRMSREHRRKIDRIGSGGNIFSSYLTISADCPGQRKRIKDQNWSKTISDVSCQLRNFQIVGVEMCLWESMSMWFSPYDIKVLNLYTCLMVLLYRSVLPPHK